MSDANFASLGATLLARKGGAKPAMRPQWGELPDTATSENASDEQLEDLGWNDMGADDATVEPSNAPAVKIKSADVVPINASAKRQPANEDTGPAAEPLIKAKPARKKAASKTLKANKKSAKPALKSQNSAPASAQVSAQTSGRRAAFTLRLDAERHLKLRLAATMQGVSAQVLVTEALDNMLSDIEGLDTLVRSMANRMKRH